MDKNEWRGVYFALLEETHGGSDDEIVAIVCRRFMPTEQDIAHIRNQASRWRADAPNWVTL